MAADWLNDTTCDNYDNSVRHYQNVALPLYVTVTCFIGRIRMMHHRFFYRRVRREGRSATGNYAGMLSGVARTGSALPVGAGVEDSVWHPASH